MNENLNEKPNSTEKMNPSKKSKSFLKKISYTRKSTLPKIVVLYFIILLATILVYPWVSNKLYAENEFKYDIINVHEHVLSFDHLEKYYPAMEEYGISKIAFLGTPYQTFGIKDETGAVFSGYDENNTEILKIANSDPDSFYALCTISPLDNDQLEKIKECIYRGGTGIKLYNGHGNFYDKFNVRLDSNRMMEVYEYCEKNKIPILYHINLSKYFDETKNILEAYPNLIIDIPHFGIDSTKLTKISELLERYPNTYTDISFGAVKFTASGFRRISRRITKYKTFFEEFQDKILFGTDLVITDKDYKNSDYIKDATGCYRNLLEAESFYCGKIIDYYSDELEKNFRKKTTCTENNCDNVEKNITKYERYIDEMTNANGLALDEEILKKIYEENPKKFLGL